MSDNQFVNFQTSSWHLDRNKVNPLDFLLMHSHWNLSDQVFLDQFASCSLPPELFTHEAHLRLTWLHLEHFGLESALNSIPLQIQAYVTKLGAQDKYHHTLTVAAVQVVEHFRQRANEHSFQELLQQFPRLRDDFKGLIHTHYSPDLYQCTEARAIYIKPDLLAF